MEQSLEKQYFDNVCRYTQHTRGDFHMHVHELVGGITKELVSACVAIERLRYGNEDEVHYRIDWEARRSFLIYTTLEFIYTGIDKTSRYGRELDHEHNVVIVGDDISTWKQCVIDTINWYLGDEIIPEIADHFYKGEYTVGKRRR